MPDLVRNVLMQLSADELRELTDWSDPVIESYLDLSSQITDMTDWLLIVIQNNASALTSIGQANSRLDELRQQVESLFEITGESRAQRAMIDAQMGLISQLLGQIRARSEETPVSGPVQRPQEQNPDIMAQGIALEAAQRRKAVRRLPAQILTRVMIGT